MRSKEGVNTEEHFKVYENTVWYLISMIIGSLNFSLNNKVLLHQQDRKFALKLLKLLIEHLKNLDKYGNLIA